MFVQADPDFEGADTYSRWLEKGNPEQLLVCVMAHTIGNKQLRGELCAKLWQVCEAMDRVTKLDRTIKELTRSAAVLEFSEIEETAVEIANARKKLIALVDQNVGDIQKKLGNWTGSV